MTTVSRIINDRPDVADQTRQRVLRVMDEIGFAPQSAWRQIRSGRTGLIAVHVPTEFNPPGYRLIMAAALGVEDAGYLINIITRPLSDAELLGLFRSRQVDGIILLEIELEDRRPEVLRDHGFPFVDDRPPSGQHGLSFVDLDVEAGIDTAFEHLVSVGHRQIALVIAPPVVQDRTHGFAASALRAYERACARHGLRLCPACHCGRAAAVHRAPVARRASGDHRLHRAAGGLGDRRPQGGATLRGLRIPHDLSLVGMLPEPVGDLGMLPITTLGFPADEMGTDRCTPAGRPPRPPRCCRLWLQRDHDHADVDGPPAAPRHRVSAESVDPFAYVPFGATGVEITRLGFGSRGDRWAVRKHW